MTQSPLPPQMPPPEPLDESERELARALRNLPVGTPPPELDARILGAARRAVHLSQPRKRGGPRWLVGLATAASALLAIGVLVKSHGPDHGAVFTPPAQTTVAAPQAAAEPSDVAASAAAATSAAKKEQPTPPADMIAPAGNATPAHAAVPVISNEEYQRQQAPQAIGGSSPVAGKQEPSAFPSTPAPKPGVMPPPPRLNMPAPPVIVEQSTPVMAASPPPSPPAALAPAVDERAERKALNFGATARDAKTESDAATAPAGNGAGLDQPELQKAEPAAPTSNPAQAGAQSSGALKSGQPVAGATDAGTAGRADSLDSVEVAGRRTKAAAADKDVELPPVADDARLPSAQWIQRIRARVKAADGDGARESLRLYQARYPDARIPSDLRPLLQ